MAKPVKKPAAAAKPAAKAIARTDVRNSPVPKVASVIRTPAPRSVAAVSIAHDQIALRAYEIWQSGQGGSEFDHWIRAERELRAV